MSLQRPTPYPQFDICRSEFSTYLISKRFQPFMKESSDILLVRVVLSREIVNETLCLSILLLG